MTKHQKADKIPVDIQDEASQHFPSNVKRET